MLWSCQTGPGMLTCSYMLYQGYDCSTKYGIITGVIEQDR